MNGLAYLLEGIHVHKAVNNGFYQKWMGAKLTIEQIAIFARNYWELTYRFPEALATLILNIDDIHTRTEYTKTLYSEMGNGNSKRAHSVLFEKFCNDLAKYLGHENYLTMDSLKTSVFILSETTSLIARQKELYSQEHPIAAGAQLALEWQAYTMIRQLYEGARNYMGLWPSQDKFHESCEFFYVHISSAEKEHKEESITAALNIITAGGQFTKIEYGFKMHLNLIAAFWGAIAFEMDNKINNQF
jgi:pyrroloquinoline quinone (PQQ) biosynthesis protein C